MTGFRFGATKVWECAHCGQRNVTTETDTFSDQCRNCTIYNPVDWSERANLSFEEARAGAAGVDGD